MSRRGSGGRAASPGAACGTIVFDAEGQRHTRPRSKRARGSEFRATLRMNRAEYEEVLTYLRSLLLPEGVNVTLNGEALRAREPVHAFEASLETEIADEEGVPA